MNVTFKMHGSIAEKKGALLREDQVTDLHSFCSSKSPLVFGIFCVLDTYIYVTSHVTLRHSASDATDAFTSAVSSSLWSSLLLSPSSLSSVNICKGNGMSRFANVLIFRSHNLGPAEN